MQRSSISSFERNIKKYLHQANKRLDDEFSGTREAIKLIAEEKTRECMQFIDRGYTREERELLGAVITACMNQSFCYGYGIGKAEGTTSRKVFL